jgi:hypothetical protein
VAYRAVALELSPLEGPLKGGPSAFLGPFWEHNGTSETQPSGKSEDEENKCRKGKEQRLKIALRFTPQHFQDSIAPSRGNEEYQKYYRKMQNGEEQRHR